MTARWAKLLECSPALLAAGVQSPTKTYFLNTFLIKFQSDLTRVMTSEGNTGNIGRVSEGNVGNINQFFEISSQQNRPYFS